MLKIDDNICLIWKVVICNAKQVQKNILVNIINKMQNKMTLIHTKFSA